MPYRPTTAESLDGLRQLQRAVADRGDICLALLLAGVELYVRAGRDLELLETMRGQTEELRQVIDNTPTADDLKRLYETE
jgi:hypothetical protein